MSSNTPAPPASADLSFAADLSPDNPFRALLDVSLNALTLLRPLYAPGSDEPRDFAFDYLNPAGQRMLGLSERPEATFLTSFPGTRETGAFAFYRQVFTTGEAGRFEVNYQHDGLDNYFYIAAQRHGERLAVSFTDTASQTRDAVETALRETQAAEQAARAEAEAQRQRFYEVLMQLPAQVATYHGPDHVFSFVNPRYQRYFPNHTLIGRSIREAIPEAGEQGIFDLLDRVYQTGKPFYDKEMEVWIDFSGTGQREQTFLELFFYPLCDAQGRIEGILDFSYDVTKQVQTRRQAQALNERLRILSEELEHRVEVRTQTLGAYAEEARRARAEAERQRLRLEGFFNQTQAAICILRGPEHLLDYYNPSYQRLFAGRPLPALPLAEVHPEVGAQGLIAPLDRVYQTGQPFAGHEVPLTLEQPDGQPPRTWYLTFSCDAYQEDGRTAGITIFAYDVTEQVLARQQNEILQAEALAATERQSQEREMFYQIFAQTPSPICLLSGPEYRFGYFNDAYQQLFPGRELLGLSVAEALPEAAAQGFVDLLDSVYQSGEPFWGYEVPLTLDQPVGHPLQTRYYTFTYQRFEENGQPAGISVFGYDVTEQVLGRQELITSNQQLTRTNADLDTFIYAASHDLKQPINNLEGLLTALSEELPAAAHQSETAHLLALMRETVERFKTTITQLTDITKLQKEHDQPAVTLDLAEVIEGVRLDLLPLMQQAGARLELDLQCSTLSFTDKNLRSVVYNLLSNSLKYRHPDRPPQVRLHCRADADHTILEVQDNGLGLPAGSRERLFGMFQRFHDHVEGTGIGLYMVRKMVENAGGKIEVESEVGVGSTFAVYLPHSPITVVEPS